MNLGKEQEMIHIIPEVSPVRAPKPAEKPVAPKPEKVTAEKVD